MAMLNATPIHRYAIFKTVQIRTFGMQSVNCEDVSRPSQTALLARVRCDPHARRSEEWGRRLRASQYSTVVLIMPPHPQNRTTSVEGLCI